MAGVPRSFSFGHTLIIVCAVFAVVLIGQNLFDWLGTSRITADDLRQAWAPDLDRFHRQHAHDPLLTEKDFPLIVERFEGLRLDLRGETARITYRGKEWQGPWTATPGSGPAATILVKWGPKNSPIGKSSAFTREHGAITIAMDAITLPLRLDPASGTP